MSKILSHWRLMEKLEEEDKGDEDEEGDKRGDRGNIIWVSSNTVAFISGFFGGIADTVLNFIPYGLHYRIQRGEVVNPFKNPWIYTPRELYRGVFAYSTITPVTCISDGVGTLLAEKGIPKPIATFLAGMLAAAVITAPVSNVIIHQQEHKRSPLQSIKFIRSNYGWYRFTTGTSLYLGREGIYSTSVFFAREWLSQQHEVFKNKLVNVVSIGLVATFLSQPLDTMATSMINQEERKGTIETARRMHAEGGLSRFYRGFWFRCYAVIAGIFVMGEVTDHIKRTLRE
jgi:hypothetical protein